MHFFDHIYICLAQLEQPAGEAAKKAAEEQGGGGNPFGLGFFLPMMLALVVMMLLMRPRKGDTKQKEKLKSLKKNDRVLTAGGILGTVITAREDTNYVTLRIDESSNTKLQIMRTSIVKILDEDDKKGE